MGRSSVHPAQDSLQPWHTPPAAQRSPGAPEEGLQGGLWRRRPSTQARPGCGTVGPRAESPWPLPVTGPVKAQNLAPNQPPLGCLLGSRTGRQSGHQAGPYATHSPSPAPSLRSGQEPCWSPGAPRCG